MSAPLRGSLRSSDLVRHRADATSLSRQRSDDVLSSVRSRPAVLGATKGAPTTPRRKVEGIIAVGGAEHRSGHRGQARRTRA